jgi:TetR/AcrR family transcriptional regulator, transcriptional repressor for nem operon
MVASAALGAGFMSLAPRSLLRRMRSVLERSFKCVDCSFKNRHDIRTMNRPREFQEEEVLDRALMAFWRLGYDACSIGHLVKSTGLQRQSLYNGFGDKDALFLAVLKRYEQHSAAELSQLDRPETKLSDLRAYMERVLVIQASRGCGACLLVRTAFGPQIREPRVRKAVTAGAEAVRACFVRVIERAVLSGELPRDTDPEQCAAYLYTVLNGLAALTKTGGSAEQVSAVLTHTFSSIVRARSKR